ncbi:MAG TPA: CocE/NonD family hydrolase [Casimicrobiaceae bacterium]|nr:CocE/NonD family hydrolase [Casimicrobiaceae bacterium]
MRFLLRFARLLAVACLAATPAAACLAALPGQPPQLVHIPLTAPGVTEAMVAGLFTPPGPGPFPVIVYSHGRSADRDGTQVPDPRGFVRYFVRKGFAVVAPIRPGYGATGGEDHEDSGVRYDIFGNCWGHPQFARAAAAARDAIAATVTWLHAQPWADATRVVLLGTSMGGLASIATAATDVEGIAATINFAGGTGGNGQAAPEHSCGSEDMEALMTVYGARTHVPSLWLYAKNDSFWGAERPRAWHRAFAHGGSETHFVLTDAVPNADGHQLLGRGSRLWMPPLDAFLHEQGF